MSRPWTLIVLLGLSAGALGGCYVVSPNALPGYAPPPPYVPPPAAGPPVPPPPTPSTGTRPPAGAATGRNCETVTVEGHWETLVRPGGQTERLWAPAHAIQVCR